MPGKPWERVGRVGSNYKWLIGRGRAGGVVTASAAPKRVRKRWGLRRCRGKEPSKRQIRRRGRRRRTG